MARRLVIFVCTVLFFSFSVLASPQEEGQVPADTSFCYKQEGVRESSDVRREGKSAPVIWDRYFYPHENYQELIRLCGRLNNEAQIRSMLDMLYDVETLLIRYNRPKGKFYMIMAMMNDRLGNKINANKYMLLAAQDFDSQMAVQRKLNDDQQFRIYELQSILLNKQKRSNILFFLFIALAGAFFFLTRESKLRHLRRKRKLQQQQENPDFIDEDLIDKINIAVNMMSQAKSPGLSAEEIASLGFDSKDDFLASFQMIIGMTPKEYYDKHIKK